MRPEDTEDQFWICKIEKIFTKEPKYSVAWFELIDDMYPLIFISSLSVPLSHEGRGFDPQRLQNFYN